jgi:hypothetical protein
MVPFLCPYQFKIQTLNPLTSLISIQTKLYHTERSLSESWRARSKTRSGFDVASVIASAALGKLQSANKPCKVEANKSKQQAPTIPTTGVGPQPCKVEPNNNK